MYHIPQIHFHTQITPTTVNNDQQRSTTINNLNNMHHVDSINNDITQTLSYIPHIWYSTTSQQQYYIQVTLKQPQTTSTIPTTSQPSASSRCALPRVGLPGINGMTSVTTGHACHVMWIRHHNVGLLPPSRGGLGFATFDCQQNGRDDSTSVWKQQQTIRSTTVTSTRHITWTYCMQIMLYNNNINIQHTNNSNNIKHSATTMIQSFCNTTTPISASLMHPH